MTEIDEYADRLKVFGWLAVLVIVILIARACYLQIFDGEKYARLADGNRIRLIPAMAPRGNFFDRNGELLVVNRPGFTVSLLPLNAPVSEEVVDRLSELLKMPKEDIQQKIDAHVGFDPIRIKTDVAADVFSVIEEQKEKYPGVVIETQPIRDYILNEE